MKNQKTLHRSRSRNAKNMGGVVLVEIAIGFPLFMIFILFSIWLAVRLNAQATLDTALGEGLRLGVTRAQTQTLMTPLLSQVDAWLAAGDGLNAHAAVEDALCSNIDDPDANCLNNYNSCTVQQLFSATTLQTLPPQYTYALIYINEALRQSLGNMVKFPCAPNADFCGSQQGMESGAGCFICRYLDSNQSSPVLPAAPIVRGTDVDSQQELGLRDSKLAIECEYQVHSAFTDALSRLIGFFSLQANLVNGTAEVSVDNLAPSSTFF